MHVLIEVGGNSMLRPSYRGTLPVTDDLDQAASHQPAIAAPAGRIDIDEDAIASIVRDAVRSCYGVVAIGQPRRRGGIVTRLANPFHRDTIAISLNDGRIAVRLSIVVEYGTPIATVARNVIETVTFQIKRTLGMEVDRVDVNVSGLRVSDRAAGSLA